ncbi:hypothetical protein [Sinorhizobium meliloti]|uniref:hypothetical protein n=1 Tax=Rhizobium meliloti TaxID=382 RepID=UPI000FD98E76|nr:hypothetical protein [Sinorhizobium meliloti]MDW9390913.1 hypothetical protein [Sinorhizobium meliloti]MDW9436081.1 hypothetical protein [Sinorhizobium meliloti]MDW9484100.1 hypothetical protein [Sinorhizobium meliloti]MDW9596193.1 hypothetical protein [Sinorhizobium meliloti]MDX0191391.1 hypothetical protein [Sinorhizobium meliloti]
MADFEESNGEQNGIASRTNPSMFHACSAYAIPLRVRGTGVGGDVYHRDRTSVTNALHPGDPWDLININNHKTRQMQPREEPERGRSMMGTPDPAPGK